MVYTFLFKYFLTWFFKESNNYPCINLSAYLGLAQVCQTTKTFHGDKRAPEKLDKLQKVQKNP